MHRIDIDAPGAGPDIPDLHRAPIIVGTHIPDRIVEKNGAIAQPVGVIDVDLARRNQASHYRDMAALRPGIIGQNHHRA